MMERSAKFLSLSGWAGIFAGIYAIAGTTIAYTTLNFKPDKFAYSINQADLYKVIGLALLTLILALGTAISLSWKQAAKKGEKIWNATSRNLLSSMAVPLISGGALIIILIVNGLNGLMAPLTLLFYGLALYNASKFTIYEVRILGLIQIGLGLVSTVFIEISLYIWIIGFGIGHIIYGIYIYYRYER